MDKLVNADRVKIFSDSAKGKVAVEFFSSLSNSSNPPLYGICFHDMHARVSSQVNFHLNKAVSAFEVKEIFQKFWSVLERKKW